MAWRAVFFRVATVLLILTAFAMSFRTGILIAIPTVLILAGLAIGPGVLMGTLGAIPPLRRSVRQNPIARKRLLIAIMFAGFIVEFMLVVFGIAAILVGGGELSSGGYDSSEFEAYSGAAIFDIWRRELVPPPFRESQPACYSDDPGICNLVSRASDHYQLGSSRWDSYLLAAVLSLPSLTAAGVMGCWITELRSPKQAEMTLPTSAG